MVRPFKMASLALSTSPIRQVPVDLHSTHRNVLAIAPTSIVAVLILRPKGLPIC